MVILISSMFFSCTSAEKMTFKNGKKWIPEDFNPDKTILLVQKFTIANRIHQKTEQKMEDYMAEKYPYKYEFVDLTTIINHEGKYADTKVYKYALVNSSHTSTERSTGYGSLTITGWDFNFYNRSNDKNYPKTNKSSSYPIMTFKPTINTIVQKFE